MLDNNNEAIEVKRYNNGIKSNIEYEYSFEELDKDNRHLGYRAPSEEPCRGEVVSYQCTRICQWYGNEDNIIYCWPYSCTITGYKPANDSDCAQGEIGGSSTVEQTLLVL
ncbi:hypothetical protein [Polaribacter sp. IC073]|uniref:hypothetical protein n=1 Tax=Polaribacter sp. IC073 TaxID=2508540 RepID=UPI0011BF0058|nr:hypothetical protein [Polaribacter sp. IC073]TXD50000.1 hypothetical protein ES045_02125 [Polaribacter sp. IC073]